MDNEILNEQNIQLGVNLNGKEEAVRYAGGILVDNGYVEKEYVEKMLDREEVTSTYMGNNVAIPHGTEDSKGTVTKTGISIVTIPDGVDFDGNTVKVLIGIAGKGDEHLEVLSKIAIVCAEEENIQKIIDADSSEQILALFNEVE
ncbi:PTS sugar transporter subunit IIA [Virgibacillus ihumii]|uniref:PTS sugar transporter subunit IIA n=1 Tax=Virgibacillus ihumii TaxID=2686091 RepID=UPI00157BE6C9|nr:PTS sugar transporter subunit IIA [Virgibacillus ihumii]